MEAPSMPPSPHRVGVSPSRWEPWREWHIGVARWGYSQPPLSPAAAAAPNSATPASSLSQADPSCHPGTLRPPRLPGGGAPPPELGVPSQTDKMVERWGRSVDRSWPSQVPAPCPRRNMACGELQTALGAWSPGRTNRVSLGRSMVPPQPPGRLGLGGINSLSLLARRPGAGGLQTRVRTQPRPAICAQRPGGPFPGAAPSPPRGSLICLL